MQVLARQLEPLTNDRIVMSAKQAASHANLLLCHGGDCQFNHVMKDGLFMGEDFEVLSKGQWKLLVRYFGEKRTEQGAATVPRPLVRSYERLGLGIRTQIEYFYEKVSVNGDLSVTVAPI